MTGRADRGRAHEDAPERLAIPQRRMQLDLFDAILQRLYAQLLRHPSVEPPTEWIVRRLHLNPRLQNGPT